MFSVELMPDYQGIAILLAANTNAVISIGVFIRQGVNRAVTDEKLERLHELTNGQSEKLNALSKQAGIEEGKVLGANQERAHPTNKEKPS